MKIVRQEVRDFDVEPMAKYISQNDMPFVLTGAGKTAYNLFCYLSVQKDGLHVIEIGTRHGSSAAMFSINPKTKVDAYDIDAGCINNCNQLPNRENVTYHLEDLLEDENLYQCLEADIIFLDITPHDGPPEDKLYQYLTDHNWDGILILDDIGPEWPKLKEWWEKIQGDEYPCYDVTDIAHHAGTGIVDFSGELEVV